MEDQPLNRAHQEDRKANRHLLNRRFDAAVKCHLSAAKFLEDAMINTNIPRALESLQLQRKYHLRQLQIISLKKTQLKALTSAIQKKLCIMAHLKSTQDDCKVDEPRSLQSAIFRTMEEADSLFELLVQKNDETQHVLSQNEIPVDTSAHASCQGTKRPKDDHIVIEELHTLNQQLRHFVEQLLIELTEYEEENKKLKNRIKELESDCKSCSGGGEKPKTIDLQVITDSSAGNSSPFSQLSPDMSGKRELPTLAPLEMPKFDYTLLKNPE